MATGDDPDPSGKFSLHCAAAKWDGGPFCPSPQAISYHTVHCRHPRGRYTIFIRTRPRRRLFTEEMSVPEVLRHGGEAPAAQPSLAECAHGCSGHGASIRARIGRGVLRQWGPSSLLFLNRAAAAAAAAAAGQIVRVNQVCTHDEMAVRAFGSDLALCARAL